VGLIPLLELLLQSAARPDTQDATGRTPLHYAVLHGRPEAAKLLIRRGAGRSVADRTGRTPLDIVMEGAQVGNQAQLRGCCLLSIVRANNYCMQRSEALMPVHCIQT